MTQKDSGFKAKKAGMCVVMVMAMLISGLAILAAPVTVAEDYIGGPYGGSLRVALESQPSSLNPLASNLNGSAIQIIDLMYDSLGRTDPYSFDLVPCMASSWTIDSVDESIVSVTLKQGMQWHDGTPVTLNDIEYTFGSNGYDIGYISSVTQDTATNTITFDLNTPDSRFFSEIMLKKIVPTGFTATTSIPNGCGPYKYASSTVTSTTLSAFDGHFMSRPYLDTITYTYYPYLKQDFSANYPYFANFDQNADPRWDGFYRAAYDLIMDKIDLIGWDLNSVQTTSNIEIGGNNTNLLMNLNTTVSRNNGMKQWYLGFNNAEDHVLNNISIRKAISYAINKEGLTVYDISGGLEKSNSMISKYNVAWFNNSIVFPDYDLTLARKYLNDALIMDYNSDGYVDLPGNNSAKPWEGITEFSFKLLGPPIEDVTPYTMSTNIITWFEQLGIKVELVNNITDVHMANIIADDYDMYLADDESATIDPQYISDIYHSENVATNKNLLNFQGTYRIENYNLMTQLLNDTIWTAQLEHTKLTGIPLVTHNGVDIPTSDYTIDLAAGIFTLDQSVVLDYVNDTLNITYTYLPFDHIMGMADKQMDPVMRAKYIKDAQAVIADMLPSIPLFSYKVYNAFRANLYVGWVETLGGVANYWTFTNLKNELHGDSVISLDAVKYSLDGGERVNLLIKVQDLERNAIKGSKLVLTGEGTFDPPTYDDIGQQYTISFTAPSTLLSRTITLKVEAYSVGYNPATDELDLTIHPISNNFVVDIVRGSLTIDSGNTTTINVLVTDKDTLLPVSGANVILTLSPTGLGGYLGHTSGTTNAAGEFPTTFGANNVTVDTTFRITAYVTKDGYVDAEKISSISVPMDPNIEETSVDKGLLGLPAPSLITLIALFSCISVATMSLRRKRN